MGPKTDAMAAAQILAGDPIPGLVVRDADGRPYTVMPGSQVLRFVIPGYVQADPQPAGVYDEQAADELCGRLAGVLVRDMLPKRPDPDDLPVVDGDANSMEVATRMARCAAPWSRWSITAAIGADLGGNATAVGAGPRSSSSASPPAAGIRSGPGSTRNTGSSWPR